MYIIMPAKKIRKVGRVRLTDNKRKAKKGGLNKTEKKQTKSIVNRAIRQNNQLKYFNSNSSDDGQAPAASTVSNKKEVSVIAYSTTSEFSNTSPGTALKYGSQDIIPMYLTRPFVPTSSFPGGKEQALDGQYVLPKTAKSWFSIERVRYMNDDGGQTPTDTPDVNIARTLPISYRIIKVDFKNITSTGQTCNPNVDLFISTTGQEKGIDSSNFDRLDCKYASVNKKKYTKLMDVHGTIHQNNIFTPNAINGTQGNSSEVVTQKVGKSHFDLKCNYQLSARKNGKMFYEDPDDISTLHSTSGGKRQMVFYHFWYDNGHNLLGGENQPESPTDEDIQIKVRCESAFVDCA